MKYFLYDLHLAQNMDNISEEEFNHNDRLWLQNVTEYQEIFKTLSNRLPHDVFEHFNSWGFHDYRLIKMEMEHESLLDLSVHFTISSDVENVENEKLWILSFQNVSFYDYHHYNYDNQKSVFHREIDDWLYQEFLPIDQSKISFEVLFSSGGNVLLHFPAKSVTIKRVK
ncbi:hypothetical protein BKP45_00495 [Anaerobacillus alkalidiazotrophicus]|uniref:DUF4085 domain-containing protein n=1 Tax=Anaerobacillus alkalidiazotrophicus TaxID=472963 RepID=A0A1S2MBQ5_9BACI|nr:hypothetical protein [Anaerobacillus alkalidiazotrophicus]OIJ21297.1 hypothetical protein BKP45_00495 [Anaerobacillus alkalidiazotrophicus]